MGFRISLWLSYGLIWALALSRVAQSKDGFTDKHEGGRCAIRGHCGKQSFFGGELPCPDNGLAEEPEKSLRQKIFDTCGPKWLDGPVCCTEEQVGRPLHEIQGIGAYQRRSMPLVKIYSVQRPSLHPVQHARRTSTTSSAPSPAPRTNRSSST